MKPFRFYLFFIGGWSHLAGGAWIETIQTWSLYGIRSSHLAGGAWIETLLMSMVWTMVSGRTSQGVRGLKQGFVLCYFTFAVSHLAGGAWIETLICRYDDPSLHGRTSQGVRGLKL